MLQLKQWTLAAAALAVGGLLATAVRPAQAQQRMHLTRGMVIGTTGTGIVQPPSSPGTVPPATTPTPAATPTPTPTPPAPVVTPRPATSTPTPGPSVTQTPTPPASAGQSAGQGYSLGPDLLGEQRLQIGRLVNRVPPDIIGVGGPSVAKVPAHH